MPVCGRACKSKAAECCVDLPCAEAAFVSGRILALIDPLNGLQVKQRTAPGGVRRPQAAAAKAASSAAVQRALSSGGAKLALKLLRASV